jgi:hypothetical protein
MLVARHHKPLVNNTACFSTVTRVPNGWTKTLIKKIMVVAVAPLVLFRTGVVQRVIQFKVRAQHVVVATPGAGEVVICVHPVGHG